MEKIFVRESKRIGEAADSESFILYFVDRPLPASARASRENADYERCHELPESRLSNRLRAQMNSLRFGNVREYNTMNRKIGTTFSFAAR
jgi:hypothetical protein